MTDTRLPDKWLLNPTLDKLSDGAWRVLTRALMFCNQQGTDGEIESVYMKYVYPWGDFSSYADELVEIGWLVPFENGFRIPGWEAKGQATAAQVELWLENQRLRQRKHRRKTKQATGRGATRDVTRDVGQDRSGQDRSGQDNYGEVSWPEVMKPGSGF
jgi:hypothetical protein